MTTTLDKSLKRELVIAQTPYTLVISPEGLHLAPKGRRKGVELRWIDLVSGEAAMAVALNASLRSVQRFPEVRTARAQTEASTRVESPRRVIRGATRSPARKTRKK